MGLVSSVDCGSLAGELRGDENVGAAVSEPVACVTACHRVPAPGIRSGRERFRTVRLLRSIFSMRFCFLYSVVSCGKTPFVVNN